MHVYNITPPVINRTYAVGVMAGGLEGRRPSKNHSFLVLVAGFAGNEHQKTEISGRLRLPEPLQRVTREYDTSYVVAYSGEVREWQSRPRTPTA